MPNDEEPLGQSHRDLLIELRSDMKYVRSTMDKLQGSEQRQWDKLDCYGQTINGHEKSIGYLTWGFRTIAGGILTILCGIAIYLATHPK